MNDPGTEKLMMMEQSMNSLIFGLLALLPVVGLPFAVAAWLTSGRAWRLEKQYWNAARPLRVAGAACAALGTVGWFLIAVAYLFHLAALGRGI